MRTLVTSVLLVIYSSFAYSLNWIAPNDPWLRADLEHLSSLHLIKQPISTWPLPISTIRKSTPNLSQSSQIKLRSMVQGKFTAELSAIQSKPIFTDFGFRHRDKSNSEVSYSYSNGLLEIHLANQFSTLNDSSPNVKHDNTYVNTNLKSWTLGVGAVDRWWGPGWDSGLILSTNARPIPSLYLARNHSRPANTRWLRWIGPWTLITFMGQLEEERAIPNALLWGMRATFKPSIAWEIGLSRTAMWAGDGRPKDFETMTDILTGNDNIDPTNTSKPNEPSNQLAGLDFKYSNHFRSNGYSIYGELIGEDEVGGRPSRPLILIGASVYFSLGQRRHTIFTEYSDTALNGHKSEQLFGIAYRHGLYTTGYLYKGRPLGSTYDNDSQILAIGTLFETSNHYKIRSTLRHLNLNRDTSVDTDDPTNNSISSQKLTTQQISVMLEKQRSSISTNFFFLWNSNDSAASDDNIRSLVGASVSLQL